ncbi:MAG: NAD(P)-binding domain-containing protein [Actinomycetota bacterium]
MPQRVAVIGGGSVGGALARGLATAGHQVVVGVRGPTDDRHDELRASVPVVSTTEAVTDAETIILAVPAAAVAEVVPTLGCRTGQVVIDATNAVGRPVPDGHATMADLVTSLLDEGVAFVKAFNTIGAEHLGDGRFDQGAAFLPIAGDPAGLAAATELGTDLGFEVADLGDRSAVGLVEDHARLWIHLAFARQWGRDFGFTVVRR